MELASEDRNSLPEKRRDPVEPILISVADFCTMLGIGKTKAYGILPGVVSIKIGSRRLILRSSAVQLVKRSIEEGHTHGPA